MAPILTRLGQSFGFGAPTGGGGSTPTPGITASGGFISDYESGGTVYRSHIFNFTGINTVGSATSAANYEVLGLVNGDFRTHA